MALTKQNYGCHLCLDYSELVHINTQSEKEIEQIIKQVLQKNSLNIACRLFNPNKDSLHIIYILQNQGHLGYYSKENGNCQIDLYLRNYQKGQQIEIDLNTIFDWKFCTTNVQLAINDIQKVYFIDQMPEKGTLQHRCQLIHKENTEYQELIVYDQKTMGRVLIIDDFINIWDQDMEDGYVKELSRHLTYKAPQDKVFDHILIIGGGDCLIVNYLLKHFPNIKKITMVELDRRVVEVIMDYFQNFAQGWVLQDNIKTGRLNLLFQNGADFVKTAPTDTFDGVIIDCTDAWTEDSPSYVLTTVPFYKDLFRIMKPNSTFSQMLSDPAMHEWFIERWNQAQFYKYEFFACFTPVYGGFTPFGYITRD